MDHNSASQNALNTHTHLSQTHEFLIATNPDYCCALSGPQPEQTMRPTSPLLNLVLLLLLLLLL